MLALGGGGRRYQPMFWASGRDAANHLVIMRSRDGKRWVAPSAMPVLASSAANLCRAPNGMLFATPLFGTAVLKSVDNGATWTTITTLTLVGAYGIAYGNGVLVVIDNASGMVAWRSADFGATWASVALTPSHVVSDNGNLLFGAGYFVVAYDCSAGGGGNNASFYSTTGATWTATTIAGAGCSYVNGLIALMGYGTGSGTDGTLALSTAANPTVAAGGWTASTITPWTYQVRSTGHIAYLGGVYVANNNTGTSKATSLSGPWTSLGIGTKYSVVAAGNGALLIHDNSAAAYHHTNDGTTYVASVVPGLTSLNNLNFC